jgi:hypothetical protein
VKDSCFVVGVGAAIVSPEADVLVYTDLARWEIRSAAPK